MYITSSVNASWLWLRYHCLAERPALILMFIYTSTSWQIPPHPQEWGTLGQVAVPYVYTEPWTWSSLYLQMAWHLAVLGHQQVQCWLQNQICFLSRFYIRHDFIQMLLTRWNNSKWLEILQNLPAWRWSTLSHAFSWIKVIIFWLGFVPRCSIVSVGSGNEWLGTKKVPYHHLNQWWTNSTMLMMSLDENKLYHFWVQVKIFQAPMLNKFSHNSILFYWWLSM